MVKKLAVDWDEHEVRFVTAQCSGKSLKVTEARVIPFEGRSVQEILAAQIQNAGHEDAETLVSIGRGKAELRELQLPPVPVEELPDMVRFQSLRSFATVGENAAVDYLVTKQLETGVEVISAAVAPQNLQSICSDMEALSLKVKRIGLRPLAAAALHLERESDSSVGEVVLIDLLSDSAEIVVAREGRVVFVRTVRMPGTASARGKVLAGELRRSLLACGVTDQLQRVVLWGTPEVHSSEIPLLEEAVGCSVQLINPFDLVEVGGKVELPEHVGRLAPLLGLMLADEVAPERLIDFLNPRKPEIKTVSPYRKLALVGIPVAACLLLAFVVYQKIASLDLQIAKLAAGNAAMQGDVKRADESLAKTETVDTFLDGDVNWLQEIRRMATEMPASEQMIIRGVSASVNARTGGGVLKIEGGAVNPAVIDEFETALRDENHQVNGTGASEQKTEDAYRWEFSESIQVTGSSIRDARYIGISEKMIAESADPNEQEPAEESADSDKIEPKDPQVTAEVAVNDDQTEAVPVESESSAEKEAESSDLTEDDTAEEKLDSEESSEEQKDQGLEQKDNPDPEKLESEASESLEVANVVDAEVQR
ncbi:MAG: hypothetical protein VXZ38_08750 [Planctomycetota bacterium]|nr:hypothetical protein [Planctomycetota bacterium]